MGLIKNGQKSLKNANLKIKMTISDHPGPHIVQVFTTYLSWYQNPSLSSSCRDQKKRSLRQHRMPTINETFIAVVMSTVITVFPGKII